MKYRFLALGLAALQLPALAAAHPEQGRATATEAEETGPQETLRAYRAAIESLDAKGMAALFTKESLVFENGKPEGSFDNYLAHHLGPELGHFISFTFTDTKLSVTEMGDTAVADESYRFVIVLKDGRKIERTGVATSVLVREDGTWKILRYHSSSRTPKKPGV